MVRGTTDSEHAFALFMSKLPADAQVCMCLVPAGSHCSHTRLHPGRLRHRHNGTGPGGVHTALPSAQRLTLALQECIGARFGFSVRSAPGLMLNKVSHIMFWTADAPHDVYNIEYNGGEAIDCKRNTTFASSSENFCARESRRA